MKARPYASILSTATAIGSAAKTGPGYKLVSVWMSRVDACCVVTWTDPTSLISLRKMLHYFNCSDRSFYSVNFQLPQYFNRVLLVENANSPKLKEMDYCHVSHHHPLT
jgi:hypothetical protein